MGSIVDLVVSSTCLVSDDRISLSVVLLAAGSFICCLLCYWWLCATISINTIRTCCGHNAEHNIGGYNDTNLPDAEIVTGAKDRDNTITVYVAKEIVTMDPTWPTAKVVACQYGRILGIGQSLEDLDPWLKRKELDPNGKDVVIDRSFENDVIVPGFVEQHGHPLIGGTALSLICVAFHDTVAPYQPMIKGCRNKKEVIDRLKKEHKKRPITDGTLPEEHLLAWGFDCIAMGCHLTKEDLNEIDPEGKRCVFVWDCSMHFAYMNTQMMEQKLGLDIKNGRKYTTTGVETDPKTGELTGAFLGVHALLKFCPPIMKQLMKPSRSLQSMHHLTEVARMGGITTMCELVMGSVNLGVEMDLYRWFYENDLTPCRCVCVIDGIKAKRFMSPFRLPLPNARANAAARWIRNQQQYSSEKLIFNNGVKFFADDSFLGLTIKLRFPGYVEPRRQKGIWNMEQGPGTPFVRELLPFWKAGCRVHVHSNGDASQDALTEVVQTLQTIHPRFDHRFCLEHYGMSAVHIHRKLKALGVNVGVNVYYALLRGQLNEAHVGKDKAHAASRLKSMVDCGLVVAMHTDTPVAPPRPLEEIWFACNRMADELETTESMFSSSNQTKKKKKKLVSICPAERITPYQAMRMKTIDAAHVHGLDGIIGSIEAGKFADFTILAENPLESDKASLRDIKVIATVVGGVKRMNVAQIRRVPIPPGDGLVGQVLWLKAMNIDGIGILPSLCRWMLLKIASLMGSSGTLEDVVLAAKERAAAATAAVAATSGDSTTSTNDPHGLEGRFCVPIEEFTPIVCKHIKPTLRSKSCYRCC